MKIKIFINLLRQDILRTLSKQETSKPNFPPFNLPSTPNRPTSQLVPMCTVGEQPVQAGEGWPEPAAGGGWQAAARYAAVPGGAGCRARGREGGVGAQAQHLPPNHKEVRAGETFNNHFLLITFFFTDRGDAFSLFSDKTKKFYILVTHFETKSSSPNPPEWSQQLYFMMRGKLKSILNFYI